MTDGEERVTEWYVRAARSGRLYFEIDVEKKESGVVRNGWLMNWKTSKRLKSNDLFVICAAGLCRRWGTRLLRLKYGLDASEYPRILTRLKQMAIEASPGDTELVALMAEYVLQAWLLDRRLRCKGEYRLIAQMLQNFIRKEERQTAQELILRTSHKPVNKRCASYF